MLERVQTSNGVSVAKAVHYYSVCLPVLAILNLVISLPFPLNIHLADIVQLAYEIVEGSGEEEEGTSYRLSPHNSA